jgi:TFIIF-interacting CTD phosphatase-like protein
LLILDLDETLIHAVHEPLCADHDFIVGPYLVYSRPGLAQFIARVRQHFELAVWTSSTRAYANEIVAAIFPADCSLRFVWSRERCTWRLDAQRMEHEWAKNLSKVKSHGFRLEQIIMVDDTPAKLAQHYGNLVRIKAFEGDPNDRELALLAHYLPTLADVPNVRCVEKRNWRAMSQSPNTSVSSETGF